MNVRDGNLLCLLCTFQGSGDTFYPLEVLPLLQFLFACKGVWEEDWVAFPYVCLKMSCVRIFGGSELFKHNMIGRGFGQGFICGFKSELLSALLANKWMRE